jgi:hypothetical protein
MAALRAAKHGQQNFPNNFSNTTIFKVNFFHKITIFVLPENENLHIH